MTILCNLLATFFFAWCAVAGWLLWDGDSSVVVRLAFTICGALGLYMSREGKMFSVLRRCFSNGVSPRIRRNILTGIVLLILVSPIIGIFWTVINQAHRIALESAIMSNLKQDGTALLQYAQEHDQTLPTDMHRKNIDRLCLSYRSGSDSSGSKYGRPFLWYGELSGLRLSDVKEPEKVVLAYSSKLSGFDSYLVLYLDGHVKHIRQRDRLNALLRLRPALIQLAKAAQARRDAKRSTR